jgi:hypothetical protein
MFVIPIGASSKIVQLRTILSNKSAGQVSRTGWLIASYNNFGVNDISYHFVFLFSNSIIILARIITNLIETRDMNMVLNLFISLILNISIVIACTVYKSEPIYKSKDKTT